MEARPLRSCCFFRGDMLQWQKPEGGKVVKRWLSMVLAAVLLLSLCACAEEPRVTAEPTQTNEPATVPATTAGEKDPQMGEFADGVYTNDFLGIRCEVSEEWAVYSDSQLAQLNGLVLDTMTDADIVEQLKKSNVAHLFYATADGGHRSVNVVLENVGVFNGVLLDEKTYMAVSVEQLPTALQSMGLTGVTATADTASFAGKKHAAVQVRGMLSEVPFYEKIVCIKTGNYFGLITVASYHEDETDALLKMFKAN